MLYIGYFIIVRGHNIRKRFAKFFYFSPLEGEKLLKQLVHTPNANEPPTNRNFENFGGAHGSGQMGPMAATWVPVGAHVPVLSPNDHPNPSQEQQKGFGESGNVKNFQVSLKILRNSNFGAFGGPWHGLQRGLAATAWGSMGAQVPVLSPNDHPNPSQGQRKGFMKNPISKNFHVPLNSQSSVKTAKSSLARGHKGGKRLGVPGVGTRDPSHGLGGPYTRKKFFRTQVQIHTQRPQYAKKFAPPPPHPIPPKRGVPRCGGVRVSKSKKSLGNHFWS